jgi:arsenite methyltransferase
MQPSTTDRPSLEALIESGMLEVESLHPGGLDLTRELTELCNVRNGTVVLDVASGTGETACLLAEQLSARVHAVDQSDELIRRAGTKAKARGLEVEFRKADAAQLPFGDSKFDAVLCECTLCLLDKTRVLREMVRVTRSGGCVGMHDLCWKEGVPDPMKRTLAEIEGERPETLEGWQNLFEQAGLVHVRTVDKSAIVDGWIRESRKKLGMIGRLSLTGKVVGRWGISGARKVLRSERVFTSGYLGYGIVVGTKP